MNAESQSLDQASRANISRNSASDVYRSGTSDSDNLYDWWNSQGLLSQEANFQAGGLPASHDFQHDRDAALQADHYRNNLTASADAILRRKAEHLKAAGPAWDWRDSRYGLGLANDPAALARDPLYDYDMSIIIDREKRDNEYLSVMVICLALWLAGVLAVVWELTRQ